MEDPFIEALDRLWAEMPPPDLDFAVADIVLTRAMVAIEALDQARKLHPANTTALIKAAKWAFAPIGTPIDE